MSRLVAVDDSMTVFSNREKKSDLPNLRLIANKTIGYLHTESDILVFPPKVEETDDRIKDSVIFSLKESRDSFSLGTGNIMGFIGRNDTELNICSRFTHGIDGNVSEKNDFFLHYMLEKVCHVNLANLKSTGTPDRIFDFLPFLFPQYLTAALKQGLYKEYQAKEYNDSNVRGVIDVNRHIRFNFPANGRIAYRTREYSFDNPVTELVRHTIECMRANDTFRHILARNKETKDAVAKIDNATPLYDRMERTKILSRTSKAIKSPYFNKYRGIQKLCRMILLREKIKYDSSENRIYGILFDGAWLWEEYLATMLREKGFVHPENRKGSGVIHPFTSRQSGRFYPDFYRPKAGTKISEELADMIVDAKYKNFDRHNPPADDIAQMISYIHVMDAGTGKFIYPSLDKNEDGSEWTVRPFAAQTAQMKTESFYIPQESDDYSSFKQGMELSEKKLLEQP